MTEETSQNIATVSSEEVPAEGELLVSAKVPEDYQDILAQYEVEFMHRYTERDPNFQSYLSKELDPPPIVENFFSGPPNRGGGNRNRHYQQGHKRGYDSGGGYDRMQQHNEYNRQYDRHRDRQYDRQYGRQYDRPYNRYTQGSHQPNCEGRRQPKYQRQGGHSGGWT